MLSVFVINVQVDPRGDWLPTSGRDNRSRANPQGVGLEAKSKLIELLCTALSVFLAVARFGNRKMLLSTN